MLDHVCVCLTYIAPALPLGGRTPADLLMLMNNVAAYLKKLGQKEHDKLFNKDKHRMIAHATGGLTRAFLKDPYHASAFFLVVALTNFDQCKGSCTFRDFLSYAIENTGAEFGEHFPIYFEHCLGGMFYSPVC